MHHHLSQFSQFSVNVSKLKMEGCNDFITDNYNHPIIIAEW